MVALFAVLMLAVLMLSSAFVVDLGMQRVGRSDMQALADMVALDLARDLDGRTVAVLQPILQQKAVQSAARNSGMVGGAPSLVVRLGVVGSNNAFQQITTGVPTAVSVTAATEVGFAFAGVTGKDSGGASRRAAAKTNATACFRLGSFVAAINSGDSTVLSPLNDLLGVNLDLVSYKALAGADLRLSQLTADPRIGSPTALLAGTVNYATLLSVMVDALKKENSSSNTVAITALTTIANAATTAAVGPIHLGNVLNVSPTDVAALEVALNVLDIVASGHIADGKNFIGVPKIQAQVPGVGFQFTGGLYLVSAAELACGAPNSATAKADTAQLDGTVGIDFTNLPSVNVPGIGTLQTPKGTGSIHVTAGSGTGQLVSPPAVQCGAGTAANPATFSVKVGTGLASYSIDTNLSVGGDAKTTDLLGLGLTNVITNLLGNILTLGSKLAVEVNVTLSIGTTVGSGQTTAGISIPPNDLTPVSTGSPLNLNISSVVATVTSVSIGGKPVTALNTVTALTNPIVNQLLTDSNGFLLKSLSPLADNINTKFVGPVATMAGIRLGGADVFGVSATCGTPQLIE
ncbi:MAG TPA: hypothetical protein VNS81_00715 [Nocardioides sp.]|nr:hypothetical protein [Nocardioides sp.]